MVYSTNWMYLTFAAAVIRDQDVMMGDAGGEGPFALSVCPDHSVYFSFVCVCVCCVCMCGACVYVLIYFSFFRVSVWLRSSNAAGS
jgi:hypothetical protein